MELLYVWIEEYNNIKRQGFNFSPKHHFHFEPNEKEGPVTGGTLTHKKINTSYPDNFFGKSISNITAIVGKNGSGKSSLIKAIAADIAGSKAIFVYVNTISIKVKSNLSGKIEYPDYIKLEASNSNIMENTMYYSPFVNANVNFFYSLHNNISNTHVLTEALKQLTEIKNSHQASFLCYDVNYKIGSYLPLYHALEMYLQIQFIKTVQGAAKLMDFKLPDSINITIYNPTEKTFEGTLSKTDAKDLLTECLRQEIQRKEEAKAKNSNESISKELEDKIKNEDLKELAALYTRKDDSSLLHFDIEDLADQLYGRKVENLSGVVKVNISLSEFNFKLAHENNFTGLVDMKSWISDIGIRLTWHDISDGEATMLSLFARLWSKLVKKPGSYIILLDEFELGLHPQWQKEAIARLIKFFELININKHHLILTSHSPFLVSDLPRENVIFLNTEKDEKGKPWCKVCEPHGMERTFGANIHSLYRSSFFMNGVMGEFAKGKIDDVIIFLNEVPKTIYSQKELERKRDEADFIITQIGEPLIREMLRKQFNEVFYSNKNIDERITKLEREIRMLKLKKRRNDTN